MLDDIIAKQSLQDVVLTLIAEQKLDDTMGAKLINQFPYCDVVITLQPKYMRIITDVSLCPPEKIYANQVILDKYLL